MMLNNKCLIIAGMHRSGTSLFASYLQKCGLHIGDSLIHPYIDNKKGYFEDCDFVSLHKKILNEHKINMFLPKFIQLNEDNLWEARCLIKNKSKNKLWGWKDPRNTLFLYFYKQLIPTANYIFIYRHPYQVIDSLIRRGTDSIIKKHPFITAKSWLIYNKKIITFFEKNKNISIIFNLDDIIKKPHIVISRINKKFATNLEPYDFEKLFDKNLLTQKENHDFKNKIVKFFYKHKLLKYFKKLEKIKDKI